MMLTAFGIEPPSVAEARLIADARLAEAREREAERQGRLAASRAASDRQRREEHERIRTVLVAAAVAVAVDPVPLEADAQAHQLARALAAYLARRGRPMKAAARPCTTEKTSG